MKNFKPIIIIEGEPKSIFFEIFFKSLNLTKIKSPIILICCEKRIFKAMKLAKFSYHINKIKFEEIQTKLKKDCINLINIKSGNSGTKTKKYIEECFNLALKILKNKITDKFINGPISKKKFFNGKHIGVTEYLAKKTNSKNFSMLIYNKSLSVCPITTHLPLKLVQKKLSKKIIFNKIILIHNFYKKILKKRPLIAVTGLNPHCESFDKNNEEKNIIIPTIKLLFNKGVKISGPYPGDTIFLKNNRKKFDVIVGMYHDQVLSPIKTLFEYDAINITLGLPFIRISPDHGPNDKMIGKNLSNPLSLIRSLQFLDF